MLLAKFPWKFIGSLICVGVIVAIWVATVLTQQSLQEEGGGSYAKAHIYALQLPH